jgi:hypothetical protein
MSITFEHSVPPTRIWRPRSAVMRLRDLLFGRTFARSAPAGRNSTEAQAWSAILHGMTCEAGTRLPVAPDSFDHL